VAIAFDNSGSTTGNAVTSLSVDITAAATGAFCYAYLQIATNQPAGSVTLAGWQQLCDIDEGTSSHFSLFRRVKQAGDTTFNAAWSSSQGASAVWSSYTGLLAAQPEEGFGPALHTTNTVTFTTKNATPGDATRWALTAAGARSTVTTGETWTAGTGMTLRSQAVNSVLRCSPAVIGDSNGVVAQSQHNYAWTLSSSEAHGGAVLAFLIPSTSATPAVPATVAVRQAVQRAAVW
jgi:hypothetical protein